MILPQYVFIRRKFRYQSWRLIFAAGVFVLCIWMLINLLEDSTPPVKVIILDSRSDLKPDVGGWNWNISGFQYFDTLEESPIRKSVVKSTSNTLGGVWLFQNPKKPPYGPDLQKSGWGNWIRLNEFQYVPPKPIMLGLRYYFEGPGRLEIKLREVGSFDLEKIVVKDENMSEQQGFCSTVIKPSFITRVIDKIEIRGFLLSKTSMIVIDQVIVILAQDFDTSRSLMYTLFPNRRCELRNNTLSPSTNLKENNTKGKKKLAGNRIRIRN